MKRRQSSFLFLFLFSSQLALANSKTTQEDNSSIHPFPSGTPVSVTTPVHSTKNQPIDLAETIQKNIAKKHTSKFAKKLTRAYTALKKGQLDRAIKLCSRVPAEDQFSDYYKWIKSQALYRKATALFLAKSYSASVKAGQASLSTLTPILESNPLSPLIRTLPKQMALIELLIANGYWGRKNWIKAQSTFEKAFYRLQSQSLLIYLTPESIGNYSESCKKKQGPYCLNWLDKLSALFLKNSEESVALFKNFPEGLDLNKASYGAPKVTATYKGPDLDLNAYNAAIKFYFEEKYSKAARELRQFLDDYPKSTYRFRARYWLAQSLLQDKEKEKATQLLEDLQKDAPLTFYGLMASFLSGKPIDLAIDTNQPKIQEDDHALQAHERFHLARAQNLIAEKANELAAMELKELKGRDSLSSEFLIYLVILNSIVKNSHTSLQLLTDLGSRGYDGMKSTYGLQAIFPVEQYDLIQHYAKQNDIDPILVLSLMKQESAFDESAGSSVGALGLMQLMPATALQTDPKVLISKLIQAEDNIRVGTSYLKKLLIRFNGNIAMALAGYNAGPNAVDRWLKVSASKKGISEFIELIPYRETREYVGSIIRNYFWYSRRLNSVSPMDLSYFWTTTITPSPSALPGVPQEAQSTSARQNGLNRKKGKLAKYSDSIIQVQSSAVRSVSRHR